MASRGDLRLKIRGCVQLDYEAELRGRLPTSQVVGRLPAGPGPQGTGTRCPKAAPPGDGDSMPPGPQGTRARCPQARHPTALPGAPPGRPAPAGAPLLPARPAPSQSSTPTATERMSGVTGSSPCRARLASPLKARAGTAWASGAAGRGRSPSPPRPSRVAATRTIPAPAGGGRENFSI